MITKPVALPRRQWGGDRRRPPLPAVAAPASDRAITIGRLAISFTIAMWIVYVTTNVVARLVNRSFRGHAAFAGENLIYVAITSALALSCLLYLVARQGALYRSRAHRRVPRAVIDASFDEVRPTMTVLVPSYREEVGVVRMTLLSAVLQEYPAMRVVLLLDDPPEPQAAEQLAALRAARALAGEITEWLAEPRERFAAESYLTRECVDPGELAADFAWARDWLRAQMQKETVRDHVDLFFTERVLGVLADDFDQLSVALLAAPDTTADDGSEGLTQQRLQQLRRRLTWTFSGEVTWFERKTYDSLSHEANKAMNLNSYIGLMGSSVEVRTTAQGRMLVPSSAPEAVTIPDADFLLTLDADSILLPEYCIRLVHVMTTPGNERIAVIQTPYSAFPGAGSRLERLAGATTDIQHIVHQGMSYYGATFWVGANAVIRKRALDDIVVVEHEGNIDVRRYVMDRTVIEDTESSLDLVVHGWTLLNYPERLSYSATPPDFGALAIQRRRWANGGLLILPKLHLVRRARQMRGEVGGGIQTLMRVNYLVSTCWSSLAVLCLLFFPFSSRLLSPLVVVMALPYFVLMAWDLKRCGYRRTDIFRVYGLNLILLPVNLAGVFKSLGQAVTGRRIPFARTPKVADRTATPLLFAVAPFVIIGFSLLTTIRGIEHQYWVNAAFAAFNMLTASYAVVALMGVRHTLVDTVLGVVERLHVVDRNPEEVSPVRRRRKSSELSPGGVPAWNEVIYRGVAATTTGEHASAGPGSFRILANGMPEVSSVTAPASDIV